MNFLGAFSKLKDLYSEKLKYGFFCFNSYKEGDENCEVCTHRELCRVVTEKKEEQEKVEIIKKFIEEKEKQVENCNHIFVKESSDSHHERYMCCLCGLYKNIK